MVLIVFSSLSLESSLPMVVSLNKHFAAALIESAYCLSISVKYVVDAGAMFLKDKISEKKDFKKFSKSHVPFLFNT